MSLAAAQFLLLCGLVALVVTPVAFVAFGVRYAARRQGRRPFLVTASFLTGALAAGVVLWHFLPAAWTLSFAQTLKATVDTETYGHAVEHYAEGVVVMLAAGGLLGGSIGAAAAALLTRAKLAA